jgi:isopenicillin N synthase-like dioxygenase
MTPPQLFTQYPPFPNDVPVASVPRISLAKLISNDVTQCRDLFDICRSVGFFLLDLSDDESGQAVLQSINTVFGITRDVFDLEEREKSKFSQNAAAGNFVG